MCDAEIVGLLLAAGAGRRMGRPKALVWGSDGNSWLRSSRSRLSAAGCVEVVTILGARADEAIPLVEEGRYIIARNWSEGMGESLKTGLLALLDSRFDGALIHLVDLPDVGVRTMQRVLAAARASSLQRATFNGVPGHPVLIGRDHWPALINSLHGDVGAANYLRRNDTRTIECGDLATGQDIDAIDEL